MVGQGGIDDILDWPKLSEETNLLSDEMASFLRANPVAYAGHRIVSNFVQADGYHGTKEYDEIPFIQRWFFPIAIFGYWMFRRVLHGLRLSDVPTNFRGHIFIMHSTRRDKRHTLTSVARLLRDEGSDVLLLCSPEALTYREAWEEDGLKTATFGELLGAIPVLGWWAILETTLQSYRGLRRGDQDAFGQAPRVVVFNFILIEALKTKAVTQTAHRPVIHTYAPMGYVLAATEFDRVFGYQHGIMYGQEAETGHQEYRRGYPFFAPINYLTWGESWHEKFRYSTHPDTRLHPTGSPWHEFLSEYDGENSGGYDVLFLSSAGRQTAAGEAAFEEFVESIIEVCSRNHWRLGIKLHPKEAGDWYADRGWIEHILVPQPEIHDALSKAGVAITTGSSTLAEALVVGTPICKWFNQESPLEEGHDLELVFNITPDTIESTLLSAMALDTSDSEALSILTYKGATERIVEAVTAVESGSGRAN